GNIHPEMGCYGIGISRIVAAAIEQSHDDKGIIWSKEISPYTTALVEINPKGEENLKNLCTQIYTSLKERGHEVLWDDRDQSAGVKFSDMELIGIPQMIIIGEKSFRENKVEFKMRGEDKIVSLIPDEVLNKIQ
ncbi:MAG: His/Gly/Thr/Pro-type tRNA ligase C-terminal domain-containing protein, partial [SAR86 cluster bacterium]|nr:His/Gly/Thr/Pro-type tRNA ligase C-terminal domain-containing protein [SAR86 cluster bacterium]